MDKINYISEVINTLQYLLPILANPGREMKMYNTVKTMFGNLGFKDIGLQLTKEKYQIHPMVMPDNTWYVRDTPNLGLSFCGDETQPHLVFNAHLDHYFAGRITNDVILTDDWLVSDGKGVLGADCKAGIALIYTIVKHLLKKNNCPSIDIIFDTCEEAGLIGITEFINEKQYQAMPFWKSYRDGKKVYTYCFDGLYEHEKTGLQPRVYITRQYALFLSKYLMNPNSREICDVVGEEIKWRKFNKKEKLFINLLDSMETQAKLSICVEKYGSSLIMLSKIVPTIMFPVGFINCHTVNEKLYLPYLNTVGQLFQ